MTPFLLALSLSDLWALIKRPAFIIAYVGVMVVLMLFVVAVALLNEYRFNHLTGRMAESAQKQAAEAQKQTVRFEMLTMVDARARTDPPPQTRTDVTLEELCRGLRDYAAGRLHLYYDPGVIRACVASLAVSRFLILQGMSGTGKTSLAFALGEFLQNPSTVIPVQPMWKERSDLLGYYNEFTKKYNETPLLRTMYRAGLSPLPFIAVLDELNIARVEYYFAEFLSLMEIPNPESRYLDVVSDVREDDPVGLKEGRIRLPDNLWFLGTANNDDSTFALSDKVYDRAMVLDFQQKAQPFDAPANAQPMPITAATFFELAQRAIEGGVSPDMLQKLNELDAFLEENFHVTFGNRIMKQITQYLPVYVACGGGELEALDDILSKKVMRKLAGLNLTYRKRETDALLAKLDALFGSGAMPCSVAAVQAVRKG